MPPTKSPKKIACNSSILHLDADNLVNTPHAQQLKSQSHPAHDPTRRMIDQYFSVFRVDHHQQAGQHRWQEKEDKP